MKISEKYSNAIVEITKFKEVAIKQLGTLQYNIIQMKKEKQKLIETIEKLKQDEQILIKQISDEYGQGFIDPNTWEFFPKETQQDQTQQLTQNQQQDSESV